MYAHLVNMQNSSKLSNGLLLYGFRLHSQNDVRAICAIDLIRSVQSKKDAQKL